MHKLCSILKASDEVLDIKDSSGDDEVLVCFSNFLEREFYEAKQAIIRVRVDPPGHSNVHCEKYVAVHPIRYVIDS